jgi:indole-3-glycerol phosphate synthase
MEQTKEVKIRDINDILESVSRIERQVELIKQGKLKVGESGVYRLDVIKEKAMLIRIIGKRM